MRHVLTLMAVIIGGGIGLCLSSHGSQAGPVPAVSASILAPTLIEKAGYWRRYCKFNDCTGAADAPVDADVDVDVTAPALNPPIVAIVPVRPVSCGEYHYWDGERCVDARYNNPYLGPR
jgi:hypothetical protein